MQNLHDLNDESVTDMLLQLLGLPTVKWYVNKI